MPVKTAVWQGRVDDQALGESFRWQLVVVGDDNRRSKSLDLRDLLSVGDATINGNEKKIPIAGCRGPITEPLAVEAIPFGEAVGNMPAHPRAIFLEKIDQ